MIDPPTPSQLAAVPLFPLPNVVLLPFAVLPLHIFEQRYKAMTEDALAGDRLIGMVLLRPGWEKQYYGQPAIEPATCVGRILSYERLPHGEFNFLLQGVCRARITGERRVRPYREASLELIDDEPALTLDEESAVRRELIQRFAANPFAATNVGRQFQTLCERKTPAAHLVDLAAFNFIDDLAIRQSLLEEADPRRRAGLVLRALDELRRVHTPAAASGHDPSLN